MGAVRKLLEVPDVDMRLAALGLTLSDLRWVMARTLEAGRGKSVYAMPTRAGTDRYHASVEALRERLVPSPAKWTLSNTHGIGKVIAPDSSFQIVVGQGTEDTCTETTPSTRRARGRRGRELLLPSLFPAEVMQGITRIARPDSGILTRILLYYATETEIRAELSVPVGLDAKWRFSAFVDRIPLGSMGDDELLAEQTDTTPPQVDVTVIRRA